MPPPDPNLPRSLRCHEAATLCRCSHLAIRVYLTLFWGDDSERAGVVRCLPGALAELLDSSRRAVVAALGELKSTGLIDVDLDAKVASRVGFISAHCPRDPSNRKHWRRAVEALPDCLIRTQALETIDSHTEAARHVARHATSVAARHATSVALSGGPGVRGSEEPPSESPSAPVGAAPAPQSESNAAQMASTDSQTGLFPQDRDLKPHAQMKRKREPFAPPSLDEARIYFASLGCQAFADGFCDFYASKDWYVGNRPMKNWQAAARNWHRENSPGGRFYKPNGRNDEDPYANFQRF